METGIPDVVTDPVNETTCIKCQHLMDVSSLPAFVQIACPECGTQQRVPGKMGAFLLVDLLGKGGMGAVFRGRDTGLDRWVAVKVMQSTFGGNPAFVETFRREAQAAAALTHPNIVQIYSFGVAHGQPYMAMELLEGGRLDQMIARGEMLNEAVVMKIGAEVAEGLMAASNINLIHGDVKPENILLDNNGIAKVVDFGLARFKEHGNEGGTAQGIWGTPYYIAPEKLRGHPSDARSDIYSLGGTLFHALALKPPFDGETPMDVVKARLKHPAPPLRNLRPGINREVEAIVGRMLEADPLKRYPNYASAVTDIRRVLSMLEPAPSAMFGQTAKKGGKFILAKKKTGTTSTHIPSMPATSSHNMSSRISRSMSSRMRTVSANLSGSMSGRVAGVSSGNTVRREASPVVEDVSAFAGAVKKIVLVTLGVCLLAGIIGGVVVYRKADERRTAESKEKNQVAKYRKNVEVILGDLQAVMADVSIREGIARGWISNATLTASAITSGLGQLPESGDLSGMDSNVTACLAVMNQYAGGTLASADLELKGLLEHVSSNKLALASLTNAVPAGQRWAAVTNVPVRTAELQMALMADEARTRKSMEAVTALKQKFDKAIQGVQAAAAKAAEEKVAEGKVAAAKAAEEQVAAEKAARIQAEINLIGETRKANIGMVQQHQFKSAAESLELVAKGLKTDEGKVAGKQAVKAYQMLVELKALFVAGVKAEVRADPDKGYSFGWLKKLDILGADDEKIVLRGGQKVLWSAVPPRQIIIFFQHYVENGDLSRHEKSQYDFAMALYIYDTMSGVETARSQVVKYLSEAVRSNSTLDDTAKAVMPDVDTK